MQRPPPTSTTSTSMRILQWNQVLRMSKGATIFTVALALFTDMLVYGIIVPILPDILHKMGRNKSDLGILVASYAIGLFIFTPIFGILSDKYKSRKIPMLFGLLGLAIATILFAYATNFYQLFLARLAQGISGGASWSIGLSMIADVFPSASLGQVMGTVMAANVLGQLLGPAIGGVLYQHVSTQSPFFFCAILAFLDFCVRMWVIPPVKTIDEPIPEIVYSADDHPQPSVGSSAGHLPRPHSISDSLQDETIIENNVRSPIFKGVAAGNIPNYSSTAISDYCHPPLQTPSSSYPSNQPSTFTFWQMLIDPSLIISNIATIAVGNLYSGLEPTLPLFFKKAFGSDETTIGLLFTAIVVPNIFVSAYAGYISDKYGRKLTSGIGILLMSLVAPFISIPHGTGYLPLFYEVLSLMALGAVSAFAMTPIMPDMADVVAKRGGDSYGQVYALFNMAYSIGMITGPIVGIALYELGFFIDLVILSSMLVPIGIASLLFRKKRTQTVYTRLDTHP